MVHRAGFPFRAAAGLLLIAAVLRLGTNLSRVDELNPEEFYRGALAQAWVEGAPVWPGEAPQIEHLRGSLLVSALAVPSFALLGPTSFALRLSGLLFHLAGLALFMLLVHRLFGRRACLLAGALFALAPPALAKIAALSYGDHMESVPFVCAAALAVLAWLGSQEAREPNGVRRAFVAGLLLGLAISWHAQARLGALVLLAACTLAAPRRVAGRQGWLGLLPGLLLGLVPMAALDVWTARPGWLVFGTSPFAEIAEHAGPGRAAKWLRFWSADLPNALQFPWRGAGAALCLLAALACAWLAVGAWRARAASRAESRNEAGAPSRARTALLGFLVGYPLVYSLTYAFSRFAITPGDDNAIQVRFILPIVPFLLLLPLAVAGARLWDGGRRGASALLLLPALLLGAAGSLSTWDLDALRHEPARRAVLWETFARHLQWGALPEAERAELRRFERASYGEPGQSARCKDFVELHADPLRFVALVARFDDQPAWTAPLRFRLPGLARPVTGDSLAVLPDALRPWAAASVGFDWGEARLPPHQVSSGAELLAEWSPDELVLLSRSFGRGLSALARPQAFDGRLLAARLAAPPPGVDTAQAAFGYGTRAGSIVQAYYPSGDRLVTEFLACVERPLHRPFARGLGSGYRWRLLEPPGEPVRIPGAERMLALLPAALAEDFRAGLRSPDPLESPLESPRSPSPTPQPPAPAPPAPDANRGLADMASVDTSR